MLNANETRLVAAPAPSSARTVTRSPPMNGRLGTKLPPPPWEYAYTRPACSPDSEPVTDTSWMSDTSMPRKLIWVSGLAVSVPGSGETSTSVPGRLALCSIVVGKHEGELAFALVLVWVLEDPQAAITTATATTATATSRTMYPFLLICAWDGPTVGRCDNDA